MTTALLWFRRDLRIGDHPALAAAARSGAVVPCFVLDPFLLARAGAPRVVALLRCLAALDRDLRAAGGRLVVREGRPADVVPALAAEVGAGSVHVTADSGPYGSRRDSAVARALGVPLVATGSPYAVDPGRLRTGSGGPFRVFSAFHRAWRQAGWPRPADSGSTRIAWAEAPGITLPAEPALPGSMVLPEMGEAAALRAWHAFVEGGLERYAAERDRPDLASTSRMSVHLKFGTIHPRTLLADLGPGHGRFAAELAWREFHAAVLAAWPESARRSFRPAMADLEVDSGPAADARFAAWTEGRTGYPLVDAGMRQLAAEGFLHNRVRMVAASFLVKDLHLDWRRGARHFMAWLADGDLASNQHGWQWTAGTGTDAAPYHRVLNPVTQARRFDPDGAYVRRFVPELAGLGAPEVFEPWRLPGGPPTGYPRPVVDHASARVEALARVSALGGRGGAGGSPQRTEEIA